MNLGNGYDNWRINGSTCTCTHCGERYYESDGGCGSCGDAYADWEAEALEGFSTANINALVDLGEFHAVGSRVYWFSGQHLWEGECTPEDAAEHLMSLLQNAFNEAGNRN